MSSVVSLALFFASQRQRFSNIELKLLHDMLSKSGF